MITVYSMRSNAVKVPDGVAKFKIDNTTALGNPFKLGPDMTRKRAIELYKTWFYLGPGESMTVDGKVYTKSVAKHISMRDQLQGILIAYKSVGNVALMCWCAPLPCHGDVIKDYLERIKE